MVKKNIWRIIKQDKEVIKKIQKNNDIPEIIATILANRGITDKDKIEKYMNPNINQLYSPFLMKDMQIAVNRINKALENDELITIYGDYDVDGITSTSILYMFLNELGCNVNYYIPDRIKEGYGLNEEAIKEIAENQTKLLITVDTGITAVNEIQVANNIGLDVIITDHHECQEYLPEALAVINPKRKDCSYPFDSLAGVGVTFKLIQGLAIENNVLDKIWKYLDIVAVGTIADIVPLQDENRVITKLAFKTIPNTWNIGLKSLMKVSGIKKDKITAGTIGFQIAPRLNAAGRLGDAKRGVELFITKDVNKAASLAEELNQENNHRQNMENEILEEAINIIENNNEIKKSKIFVIAGEGWNHGVIGIVASRIVEKYYRPTILLTIEDDIATGSARSVPEFSIFDALSSCKDLLEKFGGHEMAAGMSLTKDNIAKLRKRLNDYANKNMLEETLIPKIYADMELSTEDISIKLIEEIEKLEPYGIGNSEPKFICSGTITNITKIGKTNNHLKIAINGRNNSITGLGFNLSNYYDIIGKNQPISVICTLNINEWQDRRTPQLIIKDIQYDKNFESKIFTSLNIVENNILDHIEMLKNKKYIPDRSCYENVYRFLSKMENNNIREIYITKILEGLEYDNPEKIITIMICIKVFAELKLIDFEIVNEKIKFNLIKGKKVELTQSKLYNKLL